MRPLGPTPTMAHPTERTGNISQSIFSRSDQYTLPTTAIIEEENIETIEMIIAYQILMKI